MLTVRNEEFVRFDGGTPVVRAVLEVGSAVELPEVNGLTGRILHQGSLGWDMTAGVIYALSSDGEWHVQETGGSNEPADIRVILNSAGDSILADLKQDAAVAPYWLNSDVYYAYTSRTHNYSLSNYYGYENGCVLTIAIRRGEYEVSSGWTKLITTTYSGGGVTQYLDVYVKRAEEENSISFTATTEGAALNLAMFYIPDTTPESITASEMSRSSLVFTPSVAAGKRRVFALSSIYYYDSTSGYYITFSENGSGAESYIWSNKGRMYVARQDTPSSSVPTFTANNNGAACTGVAIDF